MAGILNNKTRIMDTILTLEGRRQMAEGELRIEFATFSDASSFYQASSSMGEADDASKRIYFEACHLPQDSITFEADDSGRLMPFPAGDLGILSGKILSGSTSKYLQVVTGTQFASLTSNLLISSLDNFKNLYSIGTTDIFSDTNTFEISQNQIAFELTDNAPIERAGVKNIDIDDAEAFYQDKRLAHLPNYQHLPPVNMPPPSNPDLMHPIGDYPRLGQHPFFSYDDLQADLVGKPSKIIRFGPTSKSNSMFVQFFEQGPDSLKKLDVIDFGSFLTDDADFPEKRIFFVGKIFMDDQQSPTFVNLFTLVFE